MRWLLAVVAAAAVATAAAAVSAASQEQYQVLILGPVGSRSLYHLCCSLAQALGDAGHSVTVLSSFKAKTSSKHAMIRQVQTGANNSLMEENNLFELYENPNKVLSVIFEAVEVIGRGMWTNEEVKQLWRDRNTFHAIIIIGYGNEVAVPFLMDYQGVHITLCTPGIEIRQMANQGNWFPFSVVPDIMSDSTQHMTFLERALNPVNHMFFNELYKYTILPRLQNLMEEIFPGMPPLDQLYTNSSLTLINGHFAIDGPVPLLPTQIEIGTINAKRPGPLPQDLAEFVDGAGENGVIYFSLGSIARSTHIPDKYKVMLVEAFRRLPQRVVWKYEGDDLDLPANVLTRGWMPQQDLLGHNKTRLFISHCGNLGLQEAQYHGVPILGLPLAFDQSRNAQRMAKNGYGLVLNWRDVTVDTFLEAVNTILHTPRYQEKLSRVSRALQDQKESPGERAVWWVEYAIRHKGAPHLVYAGKNLHFLQYVMADVLAFWLLVLAVWLLLSLYCLRMIIRYCKGAHKQNKSKRE